LEESLEDRFSPPEKQRTSKLRFSALAVFGLICILVGIILSANLQLTPHTVAQQAPLNIAQTGAYPVVTGSDGEVESPFVAVVDRVKDAVVNVSARTQNEETPWWFHGGMGISSGSGFFFREDGYILTNNHVVKGARELTVRTASGYEYHAKLVGQDSATDLAVLKVEPQEKIEFISFGDSEKLKVGDWAIAIGNPFPQQGLDRTVTVGVISAKGRSNLRFGEGTPTYQNYIQTDASINPGNSGGPLLNLRGEAVGVNAAISSPTGSSVGIGFAIPINLARSVVPDLIQSGKVRRGWLGVDLADINPRESQRQGLTAVKGSMVTSVYGGSPADRAGIQKGDVIVGFNNEAVENTNQFMVLVASVHEGQTVPVDIVRDGHRSTVLTTIADRDKAIQQIYAGRPSNSTELRVHEWLGMQLTTFTQDMARDLGIKFLEGVYVAGVFPGTPADKASISEGTIITSIKNKPVGNLGDLIAAEEGLGSNESPIPMIVLEPDGAPARKIVRP
jgi:serine protease Do